MIATLEIDGTTRRVNLSAGHSLAIPIHRDGRHPRFFVDQPVRIETLSAGGFEGRVASGGSCNVDRVSLIPHCHGTHTEGVGHLTGGAEPVQHLLEPGLIPAALCSVSPVDNGRETAAGAGPMITTDELRWPAWARALIIRTRPNEEAKCWRDYASEPPHPLLSVEAMTAVVVRGIRHLLIDTPSVDAADDGGKLLQHRRFWAMQPGDQRVGPGRSGCTITEMIFVPDSAADGLYLLSLGVGALHCDASPSAPTIFPVR